MVAITRLKVSARSNPNAVAGAIAGVVREQGCVEVHVVGAGAVNQAVKAAAIARTYLEGQGIDLVCIPSFVDVEIDGKPRTALRLLLEDHAGFTHDSAADLTVEHHPNATVADLRVERSEGVTTPMAEPRPAAP